MERLDKYGYDMLCIGLRNANKLFIIVLLAYFSLNFGVATAQDQSQSLKSYVMNQVVRLNYNLDRYVVQVAAKKSQSEALNLFVDIAQKYPNLLGDYQPVIQKADLGDRGIFYRLSIGPMISRIEADTLCSKLKEKNVTCFARKL